MDNLTYLVMVTLYSKIKCEDRLELSPSDELDEADDTKDAEDAKSD